MFVAPGSSARGDERTCDTCRAVSAQSHRAPLSFDEARPGENYPPLHPRCRCDVNPAVDDWVEWLRAHGDAGKAAAERLGAEVMRTPNDPAVEFYGSAEDDNPKRLAEIRADLDRNHVRIVWMDGEDIGYSPCSKNQPGTAQVHAMRGMSLLAWEHEYDHFLWDKEHGYPGPGVSMYDCDYHSAAERRAYGKEIDAAVARGDNELAERLRRLLEIELGRMEEVTGGGA